MYFLIVLFFVSLSGIIFMVGRKLRLIESGRAVPAQASFQMPRMDELEKYAGLIARRLGYFLLVEIIRAYLRLRQLLKKTYVDLKTKLDTWRRERGTEIPVSKEPNRFLRAAAEYKKKISKIRDEIKEEENL